MMNVSEYAAHRGCSRQAVYKALEAGRISRLPDGKIDAAQADRQWAANTDPRAFSEKPARPSPQKPGPSKTNGAAPQAESAVRDDMTLAEARRVNEILRAREREFRLGQMRGEWMHVSEVKARWREIVRRFRSKIDEVPRNLKDNLSPPQMRILCGELDHALIDLADEWAALQD